MNKIPNKIALIIPYYGTWPKFFHMYLSSLARQELVHVHFFTDIPTHQYNLPENCFVHILSLSEISKMLSKVINEETEICSGYKFCDLRPCYGELFSDYLEGYSHWAYGDIDLIYGSIEAHLPPNWNEFDIITFREEWLSGAFCIFKNEYNVNKLYEESSKHIQYFTCKEHVSFGEVCKKYKYVRNKPSSSILKFKEDASHTYVAKKAELEGRIKILRIPKLKESIQPSEYLSFDDSKIINNEGEEYMLYHFVTEKNVPSFSFPKWENVPRKFHIDITGFYQEEEFILLNRFRRLAIGNLLNIMGFLRRKGRNLKARLQPRRIGQRTRDLQKGL